MKVQCGQCPAKYAVADERLRDKKVRIHCRRCNASIVVDGKVNPPLVTSTPAHRSVRPLSSVPAPESAPPPSSPEPDGLGAPRPVAHTMMGGLEAPVARHLVAEQLQRQETLPLPTRNDGWTAFRPGMPEADRGFTEPPARGEGERWRVALTQQDLRWMSTEEIVDAFRDGAVKSETFVFRAGMPTWVTLLEVTEIAQALADAHLVSSPLQAPGALQLAEELAEEEGPSPLPQRVSSLPPPRKAARQRGSASSEEDGDSANDSEESLPFALVNERANGSKKPDPFAESGDHPMAVLDAALKQLEEREAGGRAVASHETANGAPVREPSAPLPAAVSPAPSAAPVSSPLEPVPGPVAAPPSKGGSAIWIWVSLAVLLAGAAAYVFGPQLGLKLP